MTVEIYYTNRKHEKDLKKDSFSQSFANLGGKITAQCGKKEDYSKI